MRVVRKVEDVRLLLEDVWNFFEQNNAEVFQMMKDCDHGSNGRLNPYHEEGSVLVHTRMVFEECVKRAEADFNETLFNYERWVTCAIACICHDFGKPHTRNEFYHKEGHMRVNFIGHEMMSCCVAFKPITFFLEINSNFVNTNILNDLMIVISQHTQIFKGDFEYNTFTQWQLLCDLGECDHNGRITSVESNVVYPEYSERIVNEVKSVPLNFNNPNVQEICTIFPSDVDNLTLCNYLGFDTNVVLNSLNVDYHIKKFRDKSKKSFDKVKIIPYYSKDKENQIVKWCRQFTMPPFKKSYVSFLSPAQLY